MAILDSISENTINKKDSIFLEHKIAEKDMLEDILSDKARMKKLRKPKYVQNSPKTDSLNYQDSYVIVNGKKITNEQEAIDVTQYSLIVLKEKFKKTMATSQNNENINNDY